jgi:hypothetical protein
MHPIRLADGANQNIHSGHPPFTDESGQFYFELNQIYKGIYPVYHFLA